MTSCFSSFIKSSLYQLFLRYFSITYPFEATNLFIELLLFPLHLQIHLLQQDILMAGYCALVSVRTIQK